ncbi:hypothetical protein N7478_003106 [Penicillium angulare]|uniref:uncharacterized protein n=1 Tax=Penicillium angulare TaxID=116970 RepID=UPI00253F9A36|nr:uncharacterized protein N7478_003106 [Penicillium angulare]KAJ5287420.1 hypothetical protein N7478_003106 [Penicillium angulare]
MSDSTNTTVVFITGVGRGMDFLIYLFLTTEVLTFANFTGIGRSILEAFLLRPNYIVIGSVRDKTSEKYEELKRLPTAYGSRLLLISIDSTNMDDPQASIKDIEAEGITHVDVVIANAGITPSAGPLDKVAIQDVSDALSINAMSPIQLYHATRPLLEKSSRPVWFSMTSAAGSIGNVEMHNAHFLLAYGISKATMNFFTKPVHAAHANWIAYAVHPGLVRSEMGNEGARLQGLEKAPVTLEDCATNILAPIDGATRGKTSGRFLNFTDNSELPW